MPRPAKPPTAAPPTPKSARRAQRRAGRYQRGWLRPLARAVAAIWGCKNTPPTPVVEEYEPRLMYSVDLAPHGLAVTATVTLVDKVLDAASGTFRVRLTLPNPGDAIPAGMRCKAEFAALAHLNKPARVEPPKANAPAAKGK